MIKISIVDEKLVSGGSANAVGTWDSDYDAAVLPALEEDHPCFIIYRLDTKNAYGYNFILLSYTPDFSHVREKMLYASTRSTLKSTFGSNYIADEVFGSLVEDVSHSGYLKHKMHVEAPAPLTSAEIEVKEIKANETTVHIGTSTKKSMATGVQFPLEDEARVQLQRITDGAINYVQLNLDLKSETIKLAQADNVDVDAISSLIPDNSARYHVFVYRHNHEGDQQTATVFVYSCPGYNCGIKERMLYASCKSPLLDTLEQDFGFVFDKKLEIGGSSDFSQEFLYDQLHPKKQAFVQKFARPKRPGKGGSRVPSSSKVSQDPEEDD